MTRELTVVKVVGGALGFNWLPVFVAEERQLFAEQGLRVEFESVGTVDRATSAVRAGVADLAITPPEGAIVDYIAGGELRLIAANSVRLPMSLVVRPEIGSVAELRGKRIGTSSLTEGTAVYTQLMLQQAGLSFPDDYEFVLSGMHADRWTALQHDEIDAAPQPAPWSFLAEQAGFRLLGEVSDVIPEIVFAALIGNADWIADHRAAVAALIAALSEAHTYVNDPANDPVTLATYQRITIPDDRDLANRGLAYTRELGMWPSDLRIPAPALAASIDVMIRTGLLDEQDRSRALGAVDLGVEPNSTGA